MLEKFLDKLLLGTGIKCVNGPEKRQYLDKFINGEIKLHKDLLSLLNFGRPEYVFLSEAVHTSSTKELSEALTTVQEEPARTNYIEMFKYVFEKDPTDITFKSQ